MDNGITAGGEVGSDIAVGDSPSVTAGYGDISEVVRESGSSDFWFLPEHDAINELINKNSIRGIIFLFIVVCRMLYRFVQHKI